MVPKEPTSSKYSATWIANFQNINGAMLEVADELGVAAINLDKDSSLKLRDGLHLNTASTQKVIRDGLVIAREHGAISQAKS